MKCVMHGYMVHGALEVGSPVSGIPGIMFPKRNAECHNLETES